jgi:hypothetical protein
MSQYTVGTVTTDGTATIIGVGTSWLSEINQGGNIDSFGIPVDNGGDGVLYDVASVTNDTTLQLSAPYAGANVSGVAYAITRDFTANEGIPELGRRDVLSDGIFTRAVRKIDSTFQTVLRSADRGSNGGTLAELDKAQTFSATQTLENSAPLFVLSETDAPADNGKCGVQAQGQEMRLVLLSDNLSTATPVIRATRTGASVDVVGVPNGLFALNTTTVGDSHRLRLSPVSDAGNGIVEIYGGATGTVVAKFYATSAGTGGANAANAALKVGRDAITGRSIASSGTNIASGADYAEYETKGADFQLKKGDVCGFDEAGRLTNTWALAVDFGLKTTDPGLVGGDNWFTEPEPERPELSLPDAPVISVGTLTDAEADEAARHRDICAGLKGAHAEAVAKYELEIEGFRERLEMARQAVDRISYTGKAPINVDDDQVVDYSQLTWVVPVEKGGGISWRAVKDTDITNAEYRLAIGKIRGQHEDGRPIVAVGVK